MKSILLYVLAFTGGIALAIQAGFNAQLGAMVKHPVLAVISSSIASVLFGTGFFLVTNKGSLPANALTETPWYLWFIGGLFSVIGISMYFYTIPKLGISTMITLGLCGQIIFSMIAGAYGWLDMPVEPLTMKRLAGALIMLVGVVLINLK